MQKLLRKPTYYLPVRFGSLVRRARVTSKLDNSTVGGASSTGLADKWLFSLYICGQTPRNMKALLNLRAICEQRLGSKYQIEVFDLTKNPDVARTHNITACPTVIKEMPEPRTRLIGDLSKTEVVAAKFDLPSAVSPQSPQAFTGAQSVGFTNFPLNEDGKQKFKLNLLNFWAKR